MTKASLLSSETHSGKWLIIINFIETTFLALSCKQKDSLLATVLDYIWQPIVHY